MVAENNKQPPSNQKTTSTVKVGDGGQPYHLRKILNKLKINKKLTFITVTILILLIGWAHFGQHVGEKVYAEAAGHKVYKSDTKSLIGNNKGINDHDAAVVLADKYLTQAMAKQANITVTNQDIVAQNGSSINELKAHNQFDCIQEKWLL